MTERDCYKLISSIPESAAIEVKFTRGKSIPRTAVKEHQVAALMRPNLLIRQPDFRLGFQCAPCDFVQLHNVRGFVCAVFHVPRKSLRAYFIEIRDWMHDNGRSSITEEYAKKVAEYVQELKNYGTVKQRA